MPTNELTPTTPLRACFVGSACYSAPPDPTSEKKGRLLSSLESMQVVAFLQDSWPRSFEQAARSMVTERFSWPRMVAETEELLRRVAGSAKEVSAREKPVGRGEET